MPEFSDLGVTLRAILAKHVWSFAPTAQHHLFHEKDITCDAITENNFSLRHRPIPLRDENLEKASLTTRSFISSGRISVTKVSSFPFLRGPNHRLRKLRVNL